MHHSAPAATDGSAVLAAFLGENQREIMATVRKLVVDPDDVAVVASAATATEAVAGSCPAVTRNSFWLPFLAVLPAFHVTMFYDMEMTVKRQAKQQTG